MNMKPKNYLLLLFGITSILFINCSNEEEITGINTMQDVDFSRMSDEELNIYAESVKAITMDSLCSLIRTYEKENPNLMEIEHQKKIDKYKSTHPATKDMPPLPPYKFFYGYSSYELLQSKVKVLLRNSPTNIGTGIYFVDLYNVTKIVYMYIDGLYMVPLPSPSCGFDPNAIGKGERGFTVSQNGRQCTMRTVGYQVLYHATGGGVYKFDPPLDELEYRYKILDFNN